MDAYLKKSNIKMKQFTHICISGYQMILVNRNKIGEIWIFCFRYSRRIPTVVFLLSASVSLVALACIQHWGKYSRFKMLFYSLLRCDILTMWHSWIGVNDTPSRCSCFISTRYEITQRHHDWETLSILLPVSERNPSVKGGTHSQRVVM